MWYICFGLIAAVVAAFSNKQILRTENLKYLVGIILLPLIVLPLWRLKEKEISEDRRIISLCLWFGITMSCLAMFAIVWNFLFIGSSLETGFNSEYMALVWLVSVSSSTALMKIDTKNNILSSNKAIIKNKSILINAQ